MTPESRQRIAILLRQLADEFNPSGLLVKEEPPVKEPPEAKLKKLQELGAKAISSGHKSFLVALLAEYKVKALSASDPSLYDELIRRLHDRLN